MEIITGLIRDLGFPIFVAVFCLVRLEKRLKEITCELKKFNNQRG
ncbi:hypothetical protein ES703_57747 [subsurface metagenome]